MKSILVRVLTEEKNEPPKAAGVEDEGASEDCCSEVDDTGTGANVYVYIYIYIYTCTYIHTYIHMYIYIYI